MPRTSTKRKTPTTECSNNLCIEHARAIGDLSAKAENNSNKIVNLENNISTLFNVINANHAATLTANKDIGETLAAIKTVLEQQKTNQETMMKDNNEIKEKVSNVEKEMVQVKSDITFIKEEHVQLKQEHANWEKKVNKLEHLSIFLYAVGVVVAGIAMIIIYWNDISKILIHKEEPKQDAPIKAELILPDSKVKVKSEK